jgi:hypothetical protein
MSQTAFAPPGTDAPAVLPAAVALAVLAARPQRTAGSQPAAAVVLVEIDTRAVA